MTMTSTASPRAADPAVDLALAANCGVDLRPAIRLLDRAYRYATDVDESEWQFAIEINRLRECGLSECDLRWLVRRSVVEHRTEITARDASVRCFSLSEHLSFYPDTCFTLTRRGARFAQSLLSPSPAPAQIDAPIEAVGEQRPVWDPARRILRVGNAVVKHFRVPAPSQEVIINAFADEGWAPRVDDPLPPDIDSEPIRRLQSAIMCLNRNQLRRLLRFRDDGTGTGVIWELVRSA
jgi:hypothetical protein